MFTVFAAHQVFPAFLVTPESLYEGIKGSGHVVAFLSNDMFKMSELTDDWSDVSLSLALALNKPLLIILLESLDKQALAKRRNLKVALKVKIHVKNWIHTLTLKWHKSWAKKFYFFAKTRRELVVWQYNLAVAFLFIKLQRDHCISEWVGHPHGRPTASVLLKTNQQHWQRSSQNIFCQLNPILADIPATGYRNRSHAMMR